MIVSIKFYVNMRKPAAHCQCYGLFAEMPKFRSSSGLLIFGIFECQTSVFALKNTENRHSKMPKFRRAKRQCSIYSSLLYTHSKKHPVHVICTHRNTMYYLVHSLRRSMRMHSLRKISYRFMYKFVHIYVKIVHKYVGIFYMNYACS